MSSTATMDLYFSPQPKEDASSYPTFAHVHVKAHGDSARGLKAGEKGIFINPECVTVIEFDAQIDRLIRELETVREMGRNRFAEVMQ